MINFTRKPHYDYADLLEIIRLLRSEDGCPWDKAQTHKSIRRGLLEEAYEAAEAIDNDDPVLLKEELGDVLMQVVFHADIESDAGRFTMDDVCDGVVKKLLFRHPHVFGDGHEDSPESVLVSWEQLKRREKGQNTVADSMDSVARSLPSLWRAEKLQKKAAAAGFEWPDVQGALDKLEEEVAELRRAVENGGDVPDELRRTVRRREGGPLPRMRPRGRSQRHLRKIHPSFPRRGRGRGGPGEGGLPAVAGGDDRPVERSQTFLMRS